MLVTKMLANVKRGDMFDQVTFVTEGNGLTRYIELN